MVVHINMFKTESPPSRGTRGDSRGATQVIKLTGKKIPVVMQQGLEASFTFSGTVSCETYTLAL